MLTVEQAYEVKASIIEYLKATFTFKDKSIEQAFINFIENKTNGMFKGPYVSIKLPFVKADPSEVIPLEIKPNFVPFFHQIQAFKRLNTDNGNTPKPTILTTGTGSGKTEAFLYPILDYCFKNQGKKGIKAIVLYPMNALATDQAKRIAEIVHNDDRLKNKVTAGLFIGLGRDNKKLYPDFMGPDHIIENRETILNFPPDILLTNFKMLDYALMRSQFHRIWIDNLSNPELLKFLVLDELHTYEGAQGSDVANLIRRLKLKINIPDNHLCPVGTSATIGSGDESKKLLSEFASNVFGEDFNDESIIEEHRLSIEEFFNDAVIENYLPSIEEIEQKRLFNSNGFDDFISNQLKLWNIESNISYSELSVRLKNIQIFKDLVLILNEGIIELNDIIPKLDRINKEFAVLPGWDDENKYNPKDTIIRSLITLICIAKTESGSREFPFLYTQVQLWIRELSGLLRTVKEEPEFRWREELDLKSKEKGLPAFFCRECGASGWIAIKHENKERFELDVNDTYKKYFSNNKNIYFVTPYNENNIKIDEYEPTDTLYDYLHKTTLILNNRPDTDRFRIISYRKLSNNFNIHICPQCNSKNTLNIIGTRVSTLASVSTSQILATDLDTSIEKNRKILAFSNGVQDAAHQAGYIEARNYRFTFRTALQKIINQSKESLNLPELSRQFIDYWSKQADESGNSDLEAYFYKFFPSDHVGKIKVGDYKSKEEKLKLLNEFNNRICWEVFSEFGYNAVIGRTLEKTGSSAPFFNSNKLLINYEIIKNWLKDNTLGSIDKNSFSKFLLVFLHRLRIRGGLDHIYLNKFRTGRSSYFLITQNVNKEHFLIRNFGKNSRLPKLITDHINSHGIFDLTTRTGAMNWFHAFYTKAFPLMPNNIDLVNEFYTKLLDVLTNNENEVLNVKEAEGIRNFAINPEELYISSKVVTFKCNTCGNALNISKENEEILDGAKCISYRCPGSYAVSTMNDYDNYYKLVYNRGRAPRIFAADHTGLLERRKRESIEKDFKNRPKFNSLNVLVATSTLEMGIDIGDLNSAINTSIPPLTSNFLQRIGRAGRLTGSAIIVNFASNEAHDLYYYEDPNEMMEGDINTPGCFLEAQEIIRRHFLAFCIDSWTTADPEHNEIPPIIRFLKLDNFDINDRYFFANRIIAFIKENDNSLFNQFKEAFKGKISDELFRELKTKLRDENFYQQIKKVFLSLKEEINNYKVKLQEIREYIKEKNLADSDPEKLELMREYRNIANLILLIRKRQVLEHLTNEGLLPNYAFPETGVTLKAQIRRRNPNDQSKYDLTSIELVRSAKSALKELVPDNSFYSQGYKMEISGLNIVSWREEVIDFRYCSKCDNLLVDIPPVLEKCSKCGDLSWASSRNKHKFLRMKAVNSFNDEMKAKLDDSSEDRESKFSNISRHFIFDSRSIQGSWVMQKIPFGLEYFKNVTITEVNTGLTDSIADNTDITIINGIERPVSGYIVCRSCGKASSTLFKSDRKRKEAKDYHFAFCKNRNVLYAGNSDEVFEEIFLYRKMETEALRILLPVQEFNTESSVLMFKAGITLGLKKYYRGNPDHIDIKEYSEYNQKTQRNDRYLVLYDIVPGGTGYLGKLFDKNEFNWVLKNAFENIRDCNCQYRGKDGCYKCIYTYGNQFEREELSRKKAEQIFEKIYQATPEWEYSETGLNKITNSGKIEESELEERFIKILSEVNQYNGYNSKLNLKTEDGITKYYIEFKNDTNEILFEIKPQVLLGPADGVRYTTRADFMITCISYKLNGEEDDNIIYSFKPIAVYLDGYQYHASEINNSFIKDLEKRKGIIESNKYYTWTLTWEDLDNFEDSKNDELNGIIENLTQTINKVKRHPLNNNADISLLKCKNNLARLLWYLQNVDNNRREQIIKLSIFSFQTSFGKHSLLINKVNEFINNKELNIEDFESVQNSESYLYLDALINNNFIQYRIFQSLKELNIIGNIYIDSSAISYPKDNWNLFWLLYNLVQFDNRNLSLIYSTINNEDDLQHDITDLNYILHNFDVKYHPVINRLLEKNISFNVDGYFSLTDNTGLIIAEAFLGLRDKKIIVDPLDDLSKSVFENNGYTIVNLEELDLNLI